MTLTLRIEQDDDPMSPREWDNVGTMICMHRRYTLGDDHELCNRAGDFDGWEEIEQHLRDECGAVSMLPIFMYDHSGIALSTTPFGCGWDSGRVGVIYTTAAQLKSMGVELKGAEECLEYEVKLYDQFVRGEVYAYTIEDSHGNVVENCGGFFTEDDAKNEGNSAMEWEVEHAPRPCHELAPVCQRASATEQAL